MNKEIAKNNPGITVELKVGGTTVPSTLGMVISKHLIAGNEVNLSAIGVVSNYVAIKGLINARGRMQMRGEDIVYYCYITETVIDHDGVSDEGAVKTGIRWEVMMK